MWVLYSTVLMLVFCCFDYVHSECLRDFVSDQRRNRHKSIKLGMMAVPHTAEGLINNFLTAAMGCKAQHCANEGFEPALGRRHLWTRGTDSIAWKSCDKCIHIEGCQDNKNKKRQPEDVFDVAYDNVAWMGSRRIPYKDAHKSFDVLITMLRHQQIFLIRNIKSVRNLIRMDFKR